MVVKLFCQYLESVLLKFNRNVPTFHVTDVATLCILGKSTSELLWGLSVLELNRYEQISVLTDSDLKYRLNSLLYEYNDIF